MSSDDTISPATVQEAIDILVRAFDHAESLSIDYHVDDDVRRSRITLPSTPGPNVELRHEDGQDPELVQIDG